MNAVITRAFPEKNKLKVGRISYMNVAPVYYGLENGLKPDWINLVSAPPSTLNAMLEDGRLDVSPVSSAAFARNCHDWLMLPGLSISCFGDVMSVLLVSRHPFHELDGKTLFLTQESEAAASMTRLLFSWAGIKPEYIKTRVRCIGDLEEDADAALVIGDAALKENWKHYFPHVWDLGALWRKRTGLPFVFAVWAVRKSAAEAHPARISGLVQWLCLSRKHGLRHLDDIIPRASARLGITRAQCRDYYRHLLYDLDMRHKKGLEVFFNGLFQTGLTAHKVSIQFFQPECSVFPENTDKMVASAAA